MVLHASNWVHQASLTLHGLDSGHTLKSGNSLALSDCAKLYNESEYRLSFLLSGEGYNINDTRTWLSAVLTNHRTCLDGLNEKGFVKANNAVSHNLTVFLSEALALYRKGKGTKQGKDGYQNGGILVSWSPATSRADFLVAKDGSGTHRTINEAVAAAARMDNSHLGRVIIYVKAGVYNENVEIERNANNIMMVGDGMNRTIVTGNQNVPGGTLQLRNIWDMTFENTAGPEKRQAVALRVNSDRSIFYRCSFRGYQDTLFVHSLRQFYRDCQIYGTIDFIFGNAPAVFQNCDIFVRKPMSLQANIITAQGRENPNENTGISIQGSRVRPAPDLVPVKDSFKTYLGSPWKENCKYMNTGGGASTANRLKWPGFHVLKSRKQASPFELSNFIQGESWIPESGVPFSLEI
ncbi:hypothetical protein SLEP1_g23986 [Rubroshorea leprosula]|uniref:Pectinesterase n=1 Tax=Rubroshorea leprosula TaxID=152421 RepID=A0AAV5JKE6_9ROSI|nr:hypothetical protein SLEP1_g23986 [Rubroshorea leprosula]